MRTEAPAAADAAPPPPGGPAPALAVEPHRLAIWRYLRMLGASADEADDLGQETMLVACAAALPGEPGLARAFLRGVARNLWLRTRRFWHRRREREIAAAVECLWLATAADDDGEELLAALRTCLGELAPRTRGALELHYRDGMDWQRVADQLGLKANGTKTLVQRARAALRHCIERRMA